MIRKENSGGSQAWMTALLFKPTQKGLSVDALEQNVYIASLTTPSLNVVKLLASDGSIVSTQVQYGFYFPFNVTTQTRIFTCIKLPLLKFLILLDQSNINLLLTKYLLNEIKYTFSLT